ncbi:hypothetical protein LTS10_010277 [Elasticomyces elasticus]|nr:hypothetical protein LTS10_010277 [Elasticomyces elasticus]
MCSYTRALVPATSGTVSAFSPFLKRRTNLHLTTATQTSKHTRTANAAMATISSRLAYALEVDAGDLVVAIDAEASFRLVADTLRMCKKHGAPATIAKLPEELVDHIEAYLKADKLATTAKRQVEVKKWRDCAEDSCTGFSHMSDEQKLVRVNEILPLYGNEEVKSLDPEEISPEELHDLIVDEDVFQPDNWPREHYENIKQWWDLVGRVGTVHRGLFSKHAGFALRYYGLDIAVAREGIILRWSTHTYLTLPEERRAGHLRTYREDEMELDPEVDDLVNAEFVLARQITVPDELTHSEKARFEKMIGALALPGWERRRGDEVRENSRGVPKLTMLTNVHLTP